jgi:hypothetical protein
LKTIIPRITKKDTKIVKDMMGNIATSDIDEREFFIIVVLIKA